MAVTEAQVRAHLDPEEPDYNAAAAALGPEALPVLERLVRTADPLLASKAAYLASLIPGDRAVAVLEQAARSDHAAVRVAAAAGLQKRPDVDEDVVADLVADRDPGVRKVAIKATRSRMTARGRDRAAARAGAAGEEAPGGGGGEGGGFVGDEETPGTSSPGYRGEREDGEGGGGDLGTGPSRAMDGAPDDGPDGGGWTDGPAADDGGVGPHGGGRI